MITVFYNPACSKCRRVREILDERGEDYELAEYLKAAPARDVLETLLRRLDGAPATLVRRNNRFAALGLGDADCASADAVVRLLLAHPELLERPVVMRGERAVVARPPERVFELLD